MRTDAEVLAVEVVRGHLEAYGIPHARQHANHVAAALRDAGLLANPNLTAERDRARDRVVALEGQVARAHDAGWNEAIDAVSRLLEDHIAERGPLGTARRMIRAALDPDPAEEA